MSNPESHKCGRITGSCWHRGDCRDTAFFCLGVLVILAVICLLAAGCGTVPEVRSQKSEIRPLTSVIRPPPSAPPPLPVSIQRAERSATLTAQAVAPRKQFVLTWDGDAASYAVYTGPARGQWTNRMEITTNRVMLTPGVSYGIAGLAPDYETSIVPWPSNRIERLVLEFYETPGGAKSGEWVWQTYTNTLAGDAQKYLRLRQELIGWQ